MRGGGWGEGDPIDSILAVREKGAAAERGSPE